MADVSFRAAGRSISSSYDANLSDSVDLTNGPARALLVAAEGNVKVNYRTGVTDTVFLAAGIWHPMAVSRVWSTGTDATGVKAGY